MMTFNEVKALLCQRYHISAREEATIAKSDEESMFLMPEIKEAWKSPEKYNAYCDYLERIGEDNEDYSELDPARHQQR